MQAHVPIYKATYSSVPVYEFPCQGVAVMRRKSDGWLNATQILKVAGFDKPQRTRVLEREVQKGTHEKVQGGYGKYQGTWIPPDRAMALSRQYGVDRLLQPIFDFQPTADSPPPAPKHLVAAPTRSKRKHDVAEDEDTPNVKVQRAAASRAAIVRRAAVADETFDSDEDLMTAMQERSRSPTGSDEGSEPSRTPSPVGSEVDGGEYADGGDRARNKRRNRGQSSQQFQQAAYTNDGLVGGGSAQAQLGHGPLRYARMILDYFVSESTQVPQFLVTPPADFDPNVVIDDDGHTALHWACAMGRIRIVKLLLSAGADIFRANSLGQTALMRSVMFTNNYDLRKFPELFELLHRSTINIDRNDRTVFHYIVDIALQKGKTHAARYYMETVLARLVDYPKEVADILNFQDEEGETALTLAARARSKRLVKILLDHGADPKIANRDNKTAEDYILEDERFREQELAAAGAAGMALNGDGGMAFGGDMSLDANGIATAGGASLHVPGYVPQLHTSETGQRISTKLIPKFAELLESLAQSYDHEVQEKERDLQQAQSVLTTVQAELLENQRLAQQLQAQVDELPALVQTEQNLEAELANKMGKRFRLGWEKWVRDEEQREQQYEEDVKNGNVDKSAQQQNQDLEAYRQMLDNPPADAAEQMKQLRNKLDEFKKRRQAMFEEFSKRTAEMGTGDKMAKYRKLIALGCNVPIDQVDGAIDALLQDLDDERDVVMA
ncbi:Transcription factor mbp1 [Microbotryomycetes sp. JL221]|nr:Transcription factor mbp1 [Microbotryomycetes sp. JL221]